MELIFWSILAYGLALATGLLGAFDKNKKFMWLLFIAAIYAHGYYSYLQKTSEPPSRDELNSALAKFKDEIVDDLSDQIKVPDFERIKAIANKRGININDFLTYLEQGSLLENGIKALIENQYDKANNFFEQDLVQNKKKAAKSLFFIGEIYNKQKQYQKAIEAFQMALSFAPDDYFSLNNWGNVLSKLRKHDEAIVKYKKVIEIKPDYCIAYSNLGNNLNHIGEYSLAIQYLNKAIKRCRDKKESNSNLAIIKTNWGVSLANLGKIEEAKLSFQNAIDIDPNSYPAYTALACYSKFEKAVELCKKALDLNPDYAPAYNEWGRQLMQQRLYALAEAKFRKAIEKDKYIVHAYNYLGLVLIRKATDKKPNLPDGLRGLDDILIDKKTMLEAEKFLNEAVKLFPKNADIHFTLGHVFRFLEKHDEAKLAYQKAIELNPKLNMGANSPGRYYSEFYTKF